MKISTFLLEEHNEAFIAWHQAIDQGLISPDKDNALLHVDEHSDMAANQYKSSIYDAIGTPDKIREFTYNELSIGGFIIPSILLGMFNKVYWVRQTHPPKSRGSYAMFARSYNSQGKKMKCSKLGGQEDIEQEIHPQSDLKKFDYHLFTIDEVNNHPNIILDIDLDYFSCTGDPAKLKEIYIEITESEYLEFRENKHHPLKHLLLGHQIETLEAKGSYFYVVNNYNEIYPYKEYVDKNTILERIKHFVKTLKEKDIQPLMIDICRSKISGYTPEDQCEFIQEHLINELKLIYEMDIRCV